MTFYEVINIDQFVKKPFHRNVGALLAAPLLGRASPAPTPTPATSAVNLTFYEAVNIQKGI